VTYTLEVPAGAVDAPLQISLSPVVDMGGAPLSPGFIGGVRLEPSGTRFARPAKLTMGPVFTSGGRPLLAGYNTADDGTQFNLTFAQRANREVAVVVTHFSIGGASLATETEIAEVEPLEPTSADSDASVDERMAALAKLSVQGASQQQLAEILSRWYVDVVQTAIDIALLRDNNNAELLQDAADAYALWSGLRAHARERLGDPAVFDGALAASDAHASTNLPAVFARLINAHVAGCAENDSLDAMSRASTAQQSAEELGLAVSGSPLERSAFLAKANDCLRVVVDPLTLPSPLPVNSDVSLDAQARVVFNGSPEPVAAGFEFSVSATAATITTPVGFSDASGFFTTVIRPSSTASQFTARACVVLPQTGVSDICGTASTTASDLTLVKNYATDGILNARNELNVPSLVFAEEHTDGGSFVRGGITRDTLSALARGGQVEAGMQCSAMGGAIAWFLNFRVINPTRLTYELLPSYVGSPADGNPSGFGGLEVVLDSRNELRILRDIVDNGAGAIPVVRHTIDLEPNLDYTLFVEVRCGASEVSTGARGTAELDVNFDFRLD
jgi:hypothetical protein